MSTQNPKEKYTKPPYKSQKQDPPGLEGKMTPQPDYGKDSYRGSGKLQNKVALITGGDSGIGRAVALAFAREGASVVIAYLDSHQDADQIVSDIKQETPNVLEIAGDVSVEKHCRKLIDETVKKFGRLDILVNNAAYQKTFKSIEDITESELEKTFRTNIFSMFYLSKAAIPKMNKGGSIINTASIQAIKPTASLLPYATTKGAIVTFSKALAKEAIEKGIRVNAVAPGPVWTPLIPSTMPVEEFGKNSLFGRAAQPVELSPVYVLLASDEASFITGEVYSVTGSALT